MVLSATKRVSSIASIANRSSDGGSKKAGLVHHVGTDSYAAVHMGGISSGGIRYSGPSLKKVSSNVYPFAKPSRPIGMSPLVWR